MLMLMLGSLSTCIQYQPDYYKAININGLVSVFLLAALFYIYFTCKFDVFSIYLQLYRLKRWPTKMFSHFYLVV